MGVVVTVGVATGTTSSTVTGVADTGVTTGTAVALVPGGFRIATGTAGPADGSVAAMTACTTERSTGIGRRTTGTTGAAITAGGTGAAVTAVTAGATVRGARPTGTAGTAGTAVAAEGAIAAVTAVTAGGTRSR